MTRHHEEDELSALDFFQSNEWDTDGRTETDALSRYSPNHDDASALDQAFDVFEQSAPTNAESAENPLDLQAEAPARDAADNQDAAYLFTVTNLLDTISVSAHMDGSTQQVHLAASVTRLSESELSTEIIELSELARQKGLAGQRTYLLQDAALAESITAMGLDSSEVLKDFIEHGMGLPTPEQASLAQAEAFAKRYTKDELDGSATR